MPDVIIIIHLNYWLAAVLASWQAICPSVLLGKNINTGNNKQTSTKFCIPAMLIGTKDLCPLVPFSVSLTLAKIQNVKANHRCWKLSNICQLITMNFDVVLTGMSIFRFSAEFRFFENNFPRFLKNRQKKTNPFSFTDTATIDFSKSFGKQSVTSWFALLPFPV